MTVLVPDIIGYAWGLKPSPQRSHLNATTDGIDIRPLYIYCHTS